MVRSAVAAISFALAPVTARVSAPPRGWNSWNCFKQELNESGALAVAENMVKHLLPHGYDTLVIDGGWSDAYFDEDCGDCIDAHGRPQPNVEKWPSSAGGRGLKPFIDKVHAMGLKVGMHTLRGSISLAALKVDSPVLGGNGTTVGDLGTSPCNWNKYFLAVDMAKPGAQAWLDSVYAQYSEWGLDLIKNDCVYGGNFDLELITGVHDAIRKTGHPTIFSLSPGSGDLQHAQAVADMADMYRITGDWHDCISGSWPTECGDLTEHWNSAESVQSLIGNPLGNTSFPDLDMLSPYYDTRSDPYFRFQMTFWTITRSPLFLGLDLRDPSLTAEDFALVANEDVLRVSDKSFKNRHISSKDGAHVWAANEHGSIVYVALMNNGTQAMEVGASFEELGIETSSCQQINVWTHEQMGSAIRKVSAKLPAINGAELLKLDCSEHYDFAV